MHLIQLRRAVDGASALLVCLFLVLAAATSWLVGKTDHHILLKEEALVRGEVEGQWRAFLAGQPAPAAVPDLEMTTRPPGADGPSYVAAQEVPWAADFFARTALQTALGRHGIRTRLPEGPLLIGLPGLPVMVTPAAGADGAVRYRLRPLDLAAAQQRLGAAGLRELRFFRGYRPEGISGELDLPALGGGAAGTLVWLSARPVMRSLLLPALVALAAAAFGLIVFLRVEHRKERESASAAIDAATRLASYDPLTGLYNRRMLFERLHERAPPTAEFAPLAVMVIDLDRFKWINDAFGHAAGDEALAGVGRVLVQVFGSETCVARTGGDEFVVIIEGDLSAKLAVSLGERLLDRLAREITIGGRHFPVGASIGVAMGPQHGKDGRDLLALADLAAYAAKSGGRGRTIVYDPELAAERRFRRSVARELKGALLNREIRLLYQPIVRSGDRSIAGVEALARWQHPVRGLLPPSEFIPVAEQSDLIVQLGNHVIAQALQDLADLEGLTVSVNVTGRQILSDGFADLVRQALAASGVPGSRLRLEITETSLLTDQARLQQVMESLRALGVTFAIDDFGVAYSSLNYLLLFKFNCLKIDRQFVAAMETSGDAGVIVGAITGLARSLGMETVGEGVETERQFQFLAAAGCAYVQGYLTGRPLDPHVLREVVARDAAGPRREGMASRWPQVAAA